MSPNTSLTRRQLLTAATAVALGGGMGTLLRDLLLRTSWLQFSSAGEHGLSGSVTSSSWIHQIPWMLLVINLVGVFVATIALRGPLRHHDPNDLARLVVITGFFGGFTSYSGLFVDVALVWHASVVGGLIVCLGAVAGGVAAGWLALKVRFQ